jgi:hypothetical protein
MSACETLFSPPDWVEDFRLDDEYQARAYDGAPASWRVRLKTASAFLFHRWTEAPAVKSGQILDPSRGFAARCDERPASFVLAVLDPAYDSPARLLAAVLPAVLAGVRTVLVACPGGPPAPGVCLALELAGLEDVYVFPPGSARNPGELLDMPDAAALRRGRLLLFPPRRAVPAEIFAEMSRKAGSLRLPCWQDACLPRLAFEEDRAQRKKDGGWPELLRWAQGEAEFVPLRDGGEMPPCDALFREEPLPADAALPAIPPEPAFPLQFGPGMEACWLHPDLDPRFFRVSRFAAALVLPGESRDADNR